MWLRCDRDKDDRLLVSTVYCKVCREYENKIIGMRNFSSAWINGSWNHRTSNILDHAKSDQHKAAMNFMHTALAKARNEPVQSYAPVVRSLLTIDDSQRQDFFHFLSESGNSKFFSFLMDGSTDSGNLEVELVLVVFCVKDDSSCEKQARTRYLAVVKPTRGDADGLLLGLGEALSRIGIEDIHSPNSIFGVDKMPVLIGAGTDDASVNVGAHGGMKGKLQSDLPWLFWSWCFAHRLELDINEMLLRLYYLYQNSPKKSQKLASIVSDLKEVFSLPKGGALPVRCQGTRWITHKRKALQRVIDRFGAYILTTLSQDSSVKAVDRARIQGYLKQWSRTKMLIGSAMYIEILKAPSMLSLTL